MDPTPQFLQNSLPAPKLVPALLGGLFIGILSALPVLSVANCCCLWVITGGMLATWVMQQNHPLPVAITDGAIVGMLAGLFGGIVSYGVSIPIQMYLPWLATFSDDMMRSGQDMPPELRRIMREMGPDTMLLLASLMFTGIAVVFGMLGGMLGVVFVRKPSPPVVPPPPPPPPWTPPSFQERSWPPPPPPPGDDTPPGA